MSYYFLFFIYNFFVKILLLLVNFNLEVKRYAPIKEIIIKVLDIELLGKVGTFVMTVVRPSLKERFSPLSLYHLV